MVLAAGLGTRLRPLTDSVPKILVPLLGLPMLERLLAFLGQGGITEVALNTHYLASQVSDFVQARISSSSHSAAGPAISLFHEAEILGTGGGIANASTFWGDDPLLVWNGDIVAELDFAALYEQHAARGALASLLVQERASDSLLLVDDAGTICGIDSARRKDRRLLRQPEGRTRGLAFNGVSLLSPSLRDHMPGGCSFQPFDLIDCLLDAISQGGVVQAYDAEDAFWGTTGTLERLASLEAGLVERPQLLARWTPS